MSDVYDSLTCMSPAAMRDCRSGEEGMKQVFFCVCIFLKALENVIFKEFWLLFNYIWTNYSESIILDGN